MKRKYYPERMKEAENDSRQIEWDAKRFLTKNNYLIQTDAVKNYLLPQMNYRENLQWMTYAEQIKLFSFKQMDILCAIGYNGKNDAGGAQMLVSSRAKLKNDKIFRARSEKAIQYALCEIQKSPIAPYVEALYLYGSASRDEQTYRSDVDLFLELSADFDVEEYRDAILLLKGLVTSADPELPEVDLKVVIGQQWKNDKALYFQNVLREGINIWKRR